jgi:rRNA maturation endonuclease Nob1
VKTQKKSVANSRRANATEDEDEVLNGNPPVTENGEPIISASDFKERHGRKANAYGITPTMVTTPVYAVERQANQQNVKAKKLRDKPKMFTLTCSACEQTYKSKIDVGSRCPECLKKLRHH